MPGKIAMDLSAEAIVFIVLLILVFIMSCSGNLLVVIVIWKYIRQTSITNRFIVSLAIADMFTGLASASQVLYVFIPELNNHLYPCLLRFQVVTFMTLTSQLLVTFTTFDRYIAVCYPHSYKTVMTPTFANALIAVAWIYAAIVFILPFGGVNTWTMNTPCLFQLVVEPGQLLAMALTLWIFTIVTVTMYVLILHKALQVYRQVRPCLTEQPSTSRTSGSTSSAAFEVSAVRYTKIRSVLRGAKALATVTLLFALCWLPYTYFQFRAFFDRSFLTSWEWRIANWIVFLGMANSIMNPFIYAWQRKDFNEACKRLLCRRRKVASHQNNNGACAQETSHNYRLDMGKT